MRDEPTGGAVLAAARAAALRGIALLLGLSLLVLAGSLAPPMFMMAVFDQVLTTLSVETLAWLLLALCIAILATTAAEALRALAWQAAGDRLAHHLAAPAVAAAVSEAGGGRSIQALRDVEVVRGFAASPAAAAVVDILWTPLLILVLILLSPMFAALAALAAALLLAINLLAERGRRDVLLQANAAATRGAGAMASALRCAEAVVGLGLLPALAARWRRDEDAAARLAARAARRAKGTLAVARSVRLAAGAAMVAVGAMLILADRASPGEMLAANLILARVLLPFESAAGAWHQFAAVRAAWRRLADCLGAPEPHRDDARLPRPAASLVAERVVLLPSGADRPVLRGVSFAVGPGEIVGILGPSGAGKSTLLRLVMGMSAPTAGTILLDGYSTALWNRTDLARHVGFLPQHAALPDATVAETIARLGEPEPRALLEAASLAGIHLAIAALPQGYSTTLREAGFVLSDGQRQRLSLARAFYGNPCLLVLDEPDAHLDAAGHASLVGALHAMRRRGAAILLSTHRAATADACDKLMVLQSGLVTRFDWRQTVLRDLRAAPLGVAETVAA